MNNINSGLDKLIIVILPHYLLNNRHVKGSEISLRKQSRPKSAFPCLRKLCTVAPKQLYLVPEKNENRRSQGGTRDFKPDGDDQRIVVGLKFSFPVFFARKMWQVFFRAA